jgi:hypothetical protein
VANVLLHHFQAESNEARQEAQHYEYGEQHQQSIP